VLVGARILWGMSAAVVAVLSLLPPDDLPSDLGLSDKLLHVLGYAVLGALGVLSGARWPWALLAVVGYGLALEGRRGCSATARSNGQTSWRTQPVLWWVCSSLHG